MYSNKMLLYGSAGVGKTCTMKIVAGEKPPDVRNSTPIATRPVSMYQLQKMGGKWLKYVSQDRMKLCARISKTTLGRELIEALTKTISEAGQRIPDQEVDGSREQRTSTAANSQQSAMDGTRKSQTPTPKTKPSPSSSQRSVDPDVLQVIHDVLDEMFQLIDECPETEKPLSYIHKLLVSDCGGQPQFHEVLPIFLRRMSLIIFVFKLSENLSSRPMIEYYEEGKALGTPYESDHTTEQLIKQGLQSLHSHWSNKESGKDGEAPRIIMVGTHKDEESKCGETRETKNQKLREMLLPTFEKEIIYYQGTDQVLFPMNAKCPGKEEEDMAQAIVSKFSIENRSDKRQLPMQWLGFEIMLEEITQRLKRGILSRSECLEVAHRLHLDESALDAALIYLDELSLVFYYPDILREVVFTNPQVLLDKISELVKVHHDKLHRFSDEDCGKKFFSHALISIDFLTEKVFEKHYVSGLFEPKHLVLLYRKLLIFAVFSEGKFFVPSLLRMLSSKELSTQRLSLDSLVAPLVLYFPDGPPRRGIFCALVSFLSSPFNHFPGPWKLMMPARSVTPTCLHRNCIQFMIPCIKTPCAVTLIDTLLQFEVHFDVASFTAASKLCPTIKGAITTGLRKANLTLGYTNSTPSFALLCPCGEGDPHSAAIGDELWICTLNSRVGKEFATNQLVWTTEDSTSEKCAGRYSIEETLHLSSWNRHVNNKPRLQYVLNRVLFPFLRSRIADF